MIKFTVLTLFPEMFTEFKKTSIIFKALERKLVDISVVDLRKFGVGKRKNVDDTIYGGGTGMIITIPVLDKAISSILKDYDKDSNNGVKIIYLSPKGQVLTQDKAKQMSVVEKDENLHYILICGHYEGIDARAFKLYDIEEISIGDYVLTGGELPAMVVIDTVTRLVDGVLKEDATINESHSKNELLEEPQYTKPEEYLGFKVPNVLLSGNHGEIDKYRYEESVYETYIKRPDLLSKYVEKNIQKKDYINKIIEKGGK